MLFNSWQFIFLFLPFTVVGYFTLQSWLGSRVAGIFLVVCSLFFYASWNPAYVPLICGSILFNFLIGRRLAALAADDRAPAGKLYFLVGILGNLGLLGYFKYYGFFVSNLNWALGLRLAVPQIILPLGISFFTFQQIAYLSDSYRGETKDISFWEYCLVVTLFAHITAGPIVYYGEILPQIKRRELRFNAANLSAAITLFTLGLFKKVLIADNLARYVSPVFLAAQHGSALGFLEAWGGALAYTLQLYFDFSGYSDMAIALALMFNLKFPINFNSPLKSRSLIEFWQRWHITLGRFVNAYVFMPMVRLFPGTSFPVAMACLFVSMVLMGAWHGAGWTFIGFGIIHALGVMTAHLWRRRRRRLPGPVAWALTFTVVVVALVLFRAEDFVSAGKIVSAMFRWPSSFSLSAMLPNQLTDWSTGGAWISLMLVVALVCPNSQTIVGYPQLKEEPATLLRVDRSGFRIRWAPGARFAVVTAVLFCIAVFSIFSGSGTEFLYFQF